MWKLEEILKSKIGRWSLILLPCLFALISVGRGWMNAQLPENSEDFQWKPAQVLVEGSNPYAEYLSGEQEGWKTGADGIVFFPNYPITGYGFLAPFGMMDHHTATGIWSIINLCSAVGCVALLWNLTGRKKKYGWLIAGAVFLAGSSVRDLISMGQHSLPVIFCLLAAVWASGKKWIWLSGIFLALSWIKFTITVPLGIWFIWKRRWKEAAIAFGIHLVTFAGICLWTKTGPFTYLQGFQEMAKATMSLSDFVPDVYALSSLIELAPGLPSSFSLFAPVLMIALTGWWAMKWSAGSTLQLLALLAFPASLAWFHLRYDQALLLLPLAWALTTPVGRPIQTMVWVMVASNWFLPRVAHRIFGEAGDIVFVDRFFSVITWTCWIGVYYLIAGQRMRNEHVLTFDREKKELERVSAASAAV